ncbi:ecotin [Niabella ginsenosidivorans]|uniref:Ecotin n=1 Tax=Niabella ginsenosidivorans TaxID=1176587 RepID=A0A1A9I2U4_9BACT|nr:serine protease inhibitor ecotin [Niabella ginsenosidivorans]ANH81040.1 ecotin [Niabella ginsenosidivorans]
MKKNQLVMFLGLVITLLSCGSSKKTVTTVQNKDAESQLVHFPKAKPGFKRYVITVPASPAEEKELKLELIAGKVMPTDCNTRSLNGRLEEKTLQGWGYTYYEFKTNGTVVSTMMACPDNKKTDKFVEAKPELIRYNSKLPVVIFVPDGYEVKCRIWQAGASFEAAEK